MAERLDVLGRCVCRRTGSRTLVPPDRALGPSCHEQVLVHDLLDERLREPASPVRRGESSGCAGDFLDQLCVLQEIEGRVEALRARRPSRAGRRDRSPMPSTAASCRSRRASTGRWSTRDSSSPWMVGGTSSVATSRARSIRPRPRVRHARVDQRANDLHDVERIAAGAPDDERVQSWRGSRSGERGGGPRAAPRSPRRRAASRRMLVWVAREPSRICVSSSGRYVTSSIMGRSSAADRQRNRSSSIEAVSAQCRFSTTSSSGPLLESPLDHQRAARKICAAAGRARGDGPHPPRCRACGPAPGPRGGPRSRRSRPRGGQREACRPPSRASPRERADSPRAGTRAAPRTPAPRASCTGGVGRRRCPQASILLEGRRTARRPGATCRCRPRPRDSRSARVPRRAIEGGQHLGDLVATADERRGESAPVAALPRMGRIRAGLAGAIPRRARLCLLSDSAGNGSKANA